MRYQESKPESLVLPIEFLGTITDRRNLARQTFGNSILSATETDQQNRQQVKELYKMIEKIMENTFIISTQSYRFTKISYQLKIIQLRE